jgi:hypothetical protein
MPAPPERSARTESAMQTSRSSIASTVGRALTAEEIIWRGARWTAGDGSLGRAQANLLFGLPDWPPPSASAAIPQRPKPSLVRALARSGPEADVTAPSRVRSMAAEGNEQQHTEGGGG